MTLPTMLKRPSAFVPLAMSTAALALVGIALSIYGFDGIHQPDEGGFATARKVPLPRCK